MLYLLYHFYLLLLNHYCTLHQYLHLLHILLNHHLAINQILVIDKNHLHLIINFAVLKQSIAIFVLNLFPYFNRKTVQIHGNVLPIFVVKIFEDLIPVDHLDNQHLRMNNHRLVLINLYEWSLLIIFRCIHLFYFHFRFDLLLHKLHLL